MDVCDDAHIADVTKKIKDPAQAELGRGTLQIWDEVEWATACGEGRRGPSTPRGLHFVKSLLRAG